MAGVKLINKIKQEANHYLGLPYMINILRDGKVVKERFLGGKGNWKDIDRETKKLSRIEGINLSQLTPKQLYNFQKKHKIGIDCSGLAVQLLIFYGKSVNKKIELNPRRTSADILTSAPISQRITDFDLIQTGDLIRQRNGKHVLFIIEKKGKIVEYIESSFDNRGVKYSQANIYDPLLDNQGIFRLKQLNN